MRQTLTFLLFLFFLSSCSVPPTPGPASLKVPEFMPSGGKVFTEVLSPFGTLQHGWPRIGTTDGDYSASEANAEHIRDVASYQIVIWTFNWPDYDKSPLSKVKDPFGLLRSLNPNIAVIGGTHSYLIPWSGCSNSAFAETCAVFQAVSGNDWYVYDATGKRLSAATGSWINWTQGYSDWLARFIAGQAARQCSGKPCWQGFYVETWDPPHGIGSFFTADLNRDGKQDMDPSRLTKCELDGLQMSGYAEFAQTVSRLTGLPVGGESFGPGLAGSKSPNALLGKETLYFDGAFPNGAWPDCTTDPYGGRGGYTYLGDAWGLHMASALAFQKAGTSGVLLRGDMAFPSENQAKRFVLASGMMTDFYVITHRDQKPERVPCDECMVNAAGRTTGNVSDLGWIGDPQGEPFRIRDGVTMAQAIARGERLSDDVWGRFFNNGFALTNPTGVTQSVSLPDGYATVNAAGRLGGDTSVNNGQAVRQIVVAPNDGRILRRISPVGTPVPPTQTPSPTNTPSPLPTATSRPTVTPTPVPTLTELEQVKRRVSSLETVVAGLK